MSELYAPHDIAAHLMFNKLVLQGISPEAYAQNQGLVGEIGRVASGLSDSFIGIQLLGSRAYGTSGLASDADTVHVSFDTGSSPNDRDKVTKTIENLGIPVHPNQVAMFFNIHHMIPPRADTFIDWVRPYAPKRVSALFDEGVYATPNLKLMQIAALSIFRNRTIVPEGPKAKWQELRDRHASHYVGSAILGIRIREKLAEHLGEEQWPAIQRAITNQLMDTRIKRFGLPEDMDGYYDNLLTWALDNEGALKEHRGWGIMVGVWQELARRTNG